MFKAVIVSLVVLPLTASCVLAQTNNMTSGRPSAVLNLEQCEAIWKNAVPSGDLLAQSAAAPFKLIAATCSMEFYVALLLLPSG